MKKQTLADKIAKRFFESPSVQKCWQAHMQAFGPILEPAFTDNYPARLDLTAALNHISRKELQKGLKKLQAIKSACFTDADKAAWTFCMGLLMEMANSKEDMLYCYQKAGEYGHRFYLPYLKVAKLAHTDGVFETAEENYLMAIRCLTEEKDDEQQKVLLGSIYTNLASCLTMMHRYEDAEDALRRSGEIMPDQQGRAAAQAILEAVKGNAERAHELTEILRSQSSDFYETTKQMADSILEKKHPHFYRVPVSKDNIDTFWKWFESNEAMFLKKFETGDYETAVQIFTNQNKRCISVYGT